MFINHAAREINLRVVYFGPPYAGKLSSLQYVHDRMGPGSRGQMVSAQSWSERAVFFDLVPPGLGEVRGYRFRLHLYTLTGAIDYEDSARLILRGVDGVIFVADSQPERADENLVWHHRLHACLLAHGLSPEHVPLAYQLNKRFLGNASSTAALRQLLGIGDRPCVLTEATTGEGVLEALKLVTRELLGALKDGHLVEVKSTRESRQEALDWSARAMLVGRMAEHFGEPVREYNPRTLPPNRPYFIVVEHAPTSSRPYWTYATAGLSLRSQPALGPEPYVELLAYSTSQSPMVASTLHALGWQIAVDNEAGPAFKTFDTAELEGPGLGHGTFVLGPAPESQEFCQLPHPDRERDRIFWMAVGSDAGDAKVTFLHVIAVSPAELVEATAASSKSLLERFGAQGRPPHAGWPADRGSA